MSEQIIPIPARVKNMAVGGHVAGSDDIYDETLAKEQHELNNNFNSDITILKDQVADIEIFEEAELAVEEVYTNVTTQNTGKVPSVVATAGVKNHIESNIGYYVCETSAATAIKTIAAPYYNLINGGSIRINFTQGNNVTSGLKLQIGSAAAKDVIYTNPDTGDSSFPAHTVLTIYYNSNTYVAENYKDDIAHNSRLLELLAQGAQTVLSSNKTVIYKGQEQSFNLTASAREFTPDSYKILDSSKQVLANTNSYAVTGIYSVDSLLYYAYGIKYGCNIVGKTTIQVRYPIFYGFGDSYDDITTKYAPTTSSSHVYSATSTANGQNFFILIPTNDGFNQPTTLVMGGAPFAYHVENVNIVINEVSVAYKAYISDVEYNSGTTLNVETR